MTREQARFYRWLIENRSNSLAFAMEFRQIERATKQPISLLHKFADALVERGWLRRIGRKHAFVQPIMHFRAR